MTDAETEDVEDEELPEIDEEEMADADLDALAEEVEAETAPDGEDDDGAEEDADDPDDELAPMDAGGDSWGDMYVGTLVSVSNAIIDEFGTEGAEQVDESIARQLHLDEHMDEWMAQRGKPDMPPEQAMLIGTTMFLVVVIGTKTDLVSQLLEEADL